MSDPAGPQPEPDPEPEAGPPPPPIPYTREFIVDESYASRVTWAILLRYTLRSPLLYLGLAGIIAGVVIYAIGLSGLAFVVAGVLMGIVFPALSFFASRRNIRRQLPAGSRLRSGFAHDRFAMDTPTASSALPYFIFTDAERRGEFVFLRQYVDKRWAVYPGQLFGDEDLTRFPHAHSASPQA